MLKRMTAWYYGPVVLMALVAVGISFLTRLTLTISSFSSLDPSFGQVLGIFFIGFFYDLVFCSFLVIPLVLHLWLLSDKIYHKPWRWVGIAIYLAIIGILVFSNLIPKEFDHKATLVIINLFVARLAIFVLFSFTSLQFRSTWRRIVLYIDFLVIIFLLLFNAASEYFFWQEFSARYNFIAVDYLVYTNEVIGNIRESYPLTAIISTIAVATILVFLLVKKRLDQATRAPRPLLAKRSVLAVGFLLLPVLSYLFVSASLQRFSKNAYANELAGNGVFDFSVAFLDNKLDFVKYYDTIPNEEAFRLLRQQLSSPNSVFTSNDIYDIERQVTDTIPEKHYNVVLVSIESFSASFMGSFGNKEGMTPFLDSLANQSIFFNNLYATGTRTVRGLETLSLGIIPTPGQSIVKRRDDENGDLFSIASVLNQKGYHSQYVYGGNSYFDNMGSFFSRNGYEVIDRSAIAPSSVHYANIWGVCDEDLFDLAEQKMKTDYDSGRPFFMHIMTVSNHRPFTYPEGRIDISPATKSRAGGVKYTDYAIRRFLNNLKSKPWFNNTLFVFVADHCASAAGKTTLPVTGYHIPLFIYAPAILAPRKVDALVSQTDIDPTILGLLHVSYKSKFFGRDVLQYNPSPRRAFISTYQSMGYLSDSTLVILSPVKQAAAYKPDFITGNAQQQPLSDSLKNLTIAYYQCAQWLLQHNKYGK